MEKGKASIKESPKESLPDSIYIVISANILSSPLFKLIGYWKIFSYLF